MTITGFSNNYYFVHSPLMVHVQSTNSVKLELTFTSGTKILTGTFYPINDKYKIDISQYAKMFLPEFNDSRFNIGLNGSEYDVDYLAEVSIQFTTTLNDSTTTTQTIVKKFVHGVSQPGEANFLTQGVHSIGNHVKVFSGYPFTINRLTTNTYKRIAAEIELLGDINEYATMNNLPSGPTYEIVKYPLTGIYLKWLNPKNCYSYWLFNDRKIVTGNVSNGADTQIQIDNIINQSELNTPSGVTVSETIKLFSQVPSKYHELIKTLFHSPEVYIYNLGYNAKASSPSDWSRVKVTSGYNFKSFTKNERIEIEVQKVTQPLTMKVNA